jgi:DNA-binding transcriptional LysR family regulator
VDVAIVRPPCDDEQLEIVKLFSEPTVLCFSADHRLADAEAVSLADVLDEPMIELVRTPSRWREYWELNDVRGGPPRRIHPEPAVTLTELRYSLLREPVVAAASGSAWRYGLSSPYLRAIPLLDARPNEIAVAHRRSPPRAWVGEFARCAREVSEQLVDLVPGGLLIPG